MTRPPVLPPDLERLLAAIGASLEHGRSVAGELPAVTAGLAALPATAVSQAAPMIAHTARLYRHRPGPSPFARLFLQRLSEKEQLLRLPELRYLFLFHFDGRIRELALQRMTGALPTPFLFAAIALRLNDWVEPVREAALASARRCFPRTAPEVIAGAATALLLRHGSWGRWGKERETVDSVYARPDVAAALADMLVAMPTGPAARTLRMALRRDSLDPHLERLAAEARQPAVRAAAVGMIAGMRASWPEGWEYQWVDKSMGRRKRVRTIKSREIVLPMDSERVVRAAARDKSAMVRRAALDTLIRHRLESGDARELAAMLKDDANPSVRERAAFILR